jgi:hypothetical protein
VDGLITRSQNVEHCRHSFAFVLRAMRAMPEPYGSRNPVRHVAWTGVQSRTAFVR